MLVHDEEMIRRHPCGGDGMGKRTEGEAGVEGGGGGGGKEGEQRERGVGVRRG